MPKDARVKNTRFGMSGNACASRARTTALHAAVCRYRRRCSQQNGVLHGRPELNTKGSPACPRSPAAECRQGAAASGAGAEDRSCSTATYRPGNGADSEHAAEYPGAFTPVLLLL